MPEFKLRHKAHFWFGFFSHMNPNCALSISISKLSWRISCAKLAGKQLLSHVDKNVFIQASSTLKYLGIHKIIVTHRSFLIKVEYIATGCDALCNAFHDESRISFSCRMFLDRGHIWTWLLPCVSACGLSCCTPCWTFWSNSDIETVFHRCEWECVAQASSFDGTFSDNARRCKMYLLRD